MNNILKGLEEIAVALAETNVARGDRFLVNMGQEAFEAFLAAMTFENFRDDPAVQMVQVSETVPIRHIRVCATFQYDVYLRGLGNSIEITPL